MTPFEAVFERCLELMPALQMQPGKALQAVQTIRAWLAEGCDPHADILPTINLLWARRPDVSSLAYFDRAVREAKDKRCGSAERDHQKARFIAFKRRLNPMAYECDSSIRSWMEAYEEKNGPVDS